MIPTKDLPSQAYLNECFSYNKITGRLKWRIRPPHHFKTIGAYRMFRSKFTGSSATYKTKHGYLLTGLDYKVYLTHRLIWKMVTGDAPPIIDHKNTKGDDNRWENLRIANHSENCWNSRTSKNNTSGAKGIHVYKSTGKCQAFIGINGKRVHLGLFQDIESAKRARMEAAAILHKEFANNG